MITPSVKPKLCRLLRIAEIVSAIAIALWLVLCLLLYGAQDKLLFYPKKLSVEAFAQAGDPPGVDTVELAMADGTVVRGWFVTNKANKENNLLFYFGGNAEEVSRLIERMGELEGWAVVLMNYRGYGASDGTASETTMYSDALEIYDHFTQMDDYSNGKVVLMGRSIGTGVAAYVASQRDTSSVILVSPYDSMTSVVQEMIPFVPVNLILRHKFNTIERAPGITSPLLILTGSEDTTIPVWHSRLVADHWGGDVKMVEIVGDHNSMSRQEGYWEEIYMFLDK